MSRANHYDVINMGTGAGGGTPASALAPFGKGASAMNDAINGQSRLEGFPIGWMILWALLALCLLDAPVKAQPLTPAHAQHNLIAGD